MTVIRITQDINGNEIPKEMIGETYFVEKHTANGVLIIVEDKYNSREFDLYREEYEELTEQEISDILIRKLKRMGRKFYDFGQY